MLRGVGRAVTLSRERIQTIRPILDADLWLVRRWVLQIVETDGREHSVFSLVALSFFGRRSARLDRQAAELGSWWERGRATP